MLLDTSGLLCLLHRDEPQHDRAKQLYVSAHDRLTHSYVLDELIALALRRKVNRTQVLVYSTSILDTPRVEIVWVDELLHRSALALLGGRKDKTYSLCDAVSFVLMRERGLHEALTTDKHFEQEGFKRLLAP
jgi:predicted nucleic acid-binding protein